MLNGLKQLEHDLLLQTFANSRQQVGYRWRVWKGEDENSLFFAAAMSQGIGSRGQMRMEGTPSQPGHLGSLCLEATLQKSGMEKGKKKKVEFNGKLTVDEAFAPLENIRLACSLSREHRCGASKAGTIGDSRQGAKIKEKQQNTLRGLPRALACEHKQGRKDSSHLLDSTRKNIGKGNDSAKCYIFGGIIELHNCGQQMSKPDSSQVPFIRASRGRWPQ